MKSPLAQLENMLYRLQRLLPGRPFVRLYQLHSVILGFKTVRSAFKIGKNTNLVLAVVPAVTLNDPHASLLCVVLNLL
jgi:hypothetical protein